jgi:hypothetical protein
MIPFTGQSVHACFSHTLLKILQFHHITEDVHTENGIFGFLVLIAWYFNDILIDIIARMGKLNDNMSPTILYEKGEAKFGLSLK